MDESTSHKRNDAPLKIKQHEVSIDGLNVEGVAGFNLNYALDTGSGLEAISITLEIDLRTYVLQIENCSIQPYS